MRRFGQILGIRPDRVGEYKRFHARIWPEIESAIRAHHIRNYSIFLWEDKLFAYYEYVGQDYEADMRGIAASPRMREWWDIMEPMQDPVPTRKKGEWWAEMEEVFHTD